MQCTKCGSEIAQNMKFCTNCGAPAPVPSAQRGASVCASCGAALLPGVKFCTGCGAPVGNGSAPAQAGKVCRSCGAEIVPGVKFCTECGAPVNDGGGSPSDGSTCRSCGARLAPGVKFCTECGTPAVDGGSSASGEAVCRSCGAKIMPGVKFCTECGAPVSGGRIEVDLDPPAPVSVCKACGMKLIPGLKFCPACGAVVDDVSGTDSTPVVPRELVLTCQERPEIQYVIPVQNEITIGRQGTDLVIADDPEVSRLHCRVYLKNGAIYIADAGSRNGTIYKGRRLAAGEEAQVAQTGILRLGKYTYRLAVQPVQVP